MDEHRVVRLNQAALKEMRDSGLVGLVISGERDIVEVAADILRFARDFSDDISESR